ncbi:sensor histidine kinase [Undibacterium sp. RuRC25W]|uniref:sensor histidine kinase n=1 Tax=Undibacterium sp. RuRC25W TaxID=3413047 RepID=UPI003BF0DC61
MKLATEILVRNLTRAGDLVTSFKHVAVDRTSSKRRQFSLADLTAEILLTMNPTLSQEQCCIKQDIDKTINMDSFPGPLGQVLINLINNAIIHGIDASKDGLIHISAQRLDENNILLQIKDNGRGIPSDHLRRVFEPFFTTRLGQGGSGMGLHIVHNLVTGLLGGKIIVISEREYGGTTFQLTLPTTAPESEMTNDAGIMHK